MAKNVFKEIIIILLLCLAIILILGVLLYEYVPFNKEIPEKVSYVTPQNVKEVLQTVDGVEEDKVIRTYELEETDLNNYKRVNDYKPGKANPFSSYKTEEENTTTEGNTTTGNTTGNSTSGSNTQSSGSNSNTGFFQNKGTK